MSTNEPTAAQTETRKCVNCGELPGQHAIAGRALICKRQMYYLPEAEPVPSVPEQLASETAWLIYFDDPGKPIETFIGEGAEAAARGRYAQAHQAWSCHLFTLVTSESPWIAPVAQPEPAASADPFAELDAAISAFEHYQQAWSLECVNHAAIIRTAFDRLRGIAQDKQPHRCGDDCTTENCEMRREWVERLGEGSGQDEPEPSAPSGRDPDVPSANAHDAFQTWWDRECTSPYGTSGEYALARAAWKERDAEIATLKAAKEQAEIERVAAIIGMREAQKQTAARDLKLQEIAKVAEEMTSYGGWRDRILAIIGTEGKS